MEPTTPQRRLAAILCADVAGYSRLMADDHDATLETLTDYRRIFSGNVEQHHGRVVNAPGDSILAEFGSVVDAVACAAEIQRELAERNADLPMSRAMQFRIGVNLGDVLVRDGDLYGDGVNIAARLQALAEPGGIVISANAHEQVEGRLPLSFADMGEQQVKNIPKPIRAYAVLSRPGAAAHRVTRLRLAASRNLRRYGLAVTILGLLIAVGFLVWGAVVSHDGGLDKVSSMLPAPDVPSIAVLPFTNMSEDPAKEHFADGMTEDLITRLSRLRNLIVIARNSVFVYKGKPIDIVRLGQDLNVRYVLEGSVRTSGEGMRVTAQLIDALTNAHIWADSYDRKVSDYFSVSDEITNTIVTELEVKLLEGEKARLWRHSTSSLPAYEAFLRARAYMEKPSRENYEQSELWFVRTLEQDPEFAIAWAWYSMKTIVDFRYRWAKDQDKALEQAEIYAKAALKLDPELGIGHGHLGYVQFMKGLDEAANAEFNLALEYSVNDSDVSAIVGVAHYWMGGLETAEALLSAALRRSPTSPSWFYMFLGDTYRQLGRYEQAIGALNKSLELAPKYSGARIRLICAFAEAGQLDQAKEHVEILLRDEPGFSLERFRTVWAPAATSFRNPQALTTMEQALTKAGLK